MKSIDATSTSRSCMIESSVNFCKMTIRERQRGDMIIRSEDIGNDCHDPSYDQLRGR